MSNNWYCRPDSVQKVKKCFYKNVTQGFLFHVAKLAKSSTEDLAKFGCSRPDMKLF
jgi:hypothetical protein